MQTFFIPGKLPSRNEQDNANRRNRFSGAAMKKKYQKYIVEQLKAQKLYRVEMKADIICDWVEENRRKDPDNIHAAIKFVLDAMVGAGVLINDNQKYIGGITHMPIRVDKENPGVYVTVKER